MAMESARTQRVPGSREQSGGGDSIAAPRELTIGIAGAAGDGLDKTGDTLAQTAARRGLHVYAYNSYQSLIRGGHTWLRLRISDQKVHSHGDHLNVLIALNQDSLERHAREVEPGGVILFNGDKLSCDPSLVREGVKTLPIPFKPSRGSLETYVRVREQARLQIESRGKAVPVAFVRRVSEGERVGSVPELIAKIGRDVERVRDILAQAPTAGDLVLLP